MNAMASWTTGNSIVCSTSSKQKKENISSTLLPLVKESHRWPVDSPHKGPVMENHFNVMTSSCHSIKDRWMCLLNYVAQGHAMMTSSKGNIFRVTGHLCGEFTGPGEFPTQRPVTRNFDVYFDLRPNKRLSKQLWGWWFETQSRPIWCHRNALWICVMRGMALKPLAPGWLIFCNPL